MSNKFLHTILVVSIVVFSTIALFTSAEITDIIYPISELGNCNSQKECTDFCDQESNHMTCVSWAESKGIFTRQEAKRMKDINRMQEQAEDDYMDEDPIYGPGNCTTPKECDDYCCLEENLDECLQFSVDNDYITSDEAIEVMAKRDKGGPGGCSSREECDAFCSNPDNMEICMNFVVEEGKITREEADFMIKEVRTHQRPIERPVSPGGQDIDVNIMDVDKERVLQILSTEAGPGGCKTLDECADFCNDISRSEECMAFAKKHQLISQEEIEKAEKMMNMVGPGGCRGPEECDVYCDQEEHMDECFNFVKDNNLMSPMDIDRMEKSMELKKRFDSEGGPGGCRGREECDAYCGLEEHRKECMDFSVDSGMITEEDRQRMEIIEEKMMRMDHQNMEGGTMPSDGDMHYDRFPDDREYRDDDIDYNDMMFPSDGDINHDRDRPLNDSEYRDDGVYHDNSMFPSDGDVPSNDRIYHDSEYHEDVMPSKGRDMYYDEGKSLENEIYQNEITPYIDSNEASSDWNVQYDSSISPDSGVLPEGDTYNEDIILEDEPVSHSGGLFQPLFNQVEKFLAGAGLFVEF